ncbi:MAG: hypothetical protein ACP5F1_03530 [Thermoplasmata archaeon]|nr:hypothetical protein [Thermoplasmata archaeon]
MFEYFYPILAMASFGLSPLFYKYVIKLDVDPVIANQVKVIMTFFIMMAIFIPEFFTIWKISIYDLLIFAFISFFGILLGVVITGLFSSASPMITSFLGILIFNERKNALTLFDISLILFGLLISAI